MLPAKIKIGAANAVTTESLGLIYLSSDDILGAPVKDFEATSYPEEEGEHIIPKTVDAPFDYKVTFCVTSPVTIGQTTYSDANAVIDYFNSQICPKTDGIRNVAKVEFTSKYKKVKIVGYPKPLSEVKTFWRDMRTGTSNKDVAVVELVIRVVKPSDCNFNFTYV